MPVEPRMKSHSFTENYYLDKINVKKVEVSNHLKENPDDKVARKQIQFINQLLKEGDKSKWPTVWHEWEKNDFCWPNTKEIKNGE